MNIILLGDSIFDNAPYVNQGDSLQHQLRKLLPSSFQLQLLAKDGDVTRDVFHQLNRLPEEEVDYIFLSVGGNDALQAANVLAEPVASVKEALLKLHDVRQSFRNDYQQLLSALQNKSKHLVICTVYNTIPAVGDAALTALALFNEVILQEAMRLSIPLLDLRITCDQLSDYAENFPIEPSKFGANKIATLISTFVQQGNSASVYAH